jgi:hypothetical protein
VASAIEIAGGGSLSLIVPTPVSSAIPASEGFESTTLYFSAASSRVSPLTGTLIGFVVCPGVKLSVPEVEA